MKFIEDLENLIEELEQEYELELDRIIKTPHSRVINISSDDHKKGKIYLNTLDYANGRQAYANSKLAIFYLQIL